MAVDADEFFHNSKVQVSSNTTTDCGGSFRLTCPLEENFSSADSPGPPQRRAEESNSERQIPGGTRSKTPICEVAKLSTIKTGVAGRTPGKSLQTADRRVSPSRRTPRIRLAVRAGRFRPGADRCG